ncbi:disintegrin and metalloproteinase domain-containing protein 9 [Bombina bombina]|uniref:disintegrin and metalloproteinase domain-containing protein 9 n=1 Tax=Bombina bombina TaxID=8345 RepID=UPI00235AF109|nr:disintegrin and metalloproteinase domain-containing protein 9 [Bombina bombina]
MQPMAGTGVHYTLLISLFSITLGIQQTNFLSSYEIIIPQKLTRERRDSSGLLKEDSLSYVIQVAGKKHILHLEKKSDFIAKDFVTYTYTEAGERLSSNHQDQEDCYYRGYADGVENSVVAVSTCSGLRGLLHLENTSFGIEPLESSSDFQHLIYRLEDVKKEPMSCGVSNLDAESKNDLHSPSMTQLLRRKRALLPQTRYVELFIVVDNERFTFLNRNATAVRVEMVQLANYLDSMYTMLNIRIVLIGLEIWTDFNKISIDGSAGDVLGRFVQWRENVLVTRRRHDTAQLVLKKSFGTTAGMAFVGTVCSRSHAGGINAFTHTNVPSFASIVAHELGHNLGMNHDDGRECSCSVGSCIMNSGASGSKNFSSCSEDDFEKLTLNKGGICLLNMPKPDEAYSAPSCGNKLVDPGEECDCGSFKECELDACCEFGTCKLRAGAQCSFGSCCQSCRFSPGGTVCRGVVNECDLPEYCNGSSPFCQPDVFIQNGHPCQNSQAYCYNGMCQYYDAQCQAIFGAKAKAAPAICFRDVNSKGDRFGNCGLQGNDYRKCETRNARCGKLQCENADTMPVFGIEPSIIKTSIQGTICWGVDFQLGSDVPDPAMVNEGTKCDEGKVCSGYQCVNASVLKYDCDVQKKCGGNGVCNSNKNCHCNDGWAFPMCQTKGYGGSIDSGPTYNDKDTSLRDGLLVFFFLVVPLLLLGAFVFFRRNELKRRFCRKKRSQAHEVDRQKQSEFEKQSSGPARHLSPSREGRGPVKVPTQNMQHSQPARVPPASRPHMDISSSIPNRGPTSAGPPRNVPPSTPHQNVTPTSHTNKKPFNPNTFNVPNYMVKQPQHAPSRPPPPHERETPGSLAPSRAPPPPPV